MNQPAFIVKKPFAMDGKEKHAYQILFHAVGGKYYIWPKVQLLHLLETTNDSTNQDLHVKFNQLAYKHVDFVLCDKEDFHPILVIRFTAMTGNEDEVLHREEEMLKEILDAAHLPLLIESSTELDQYKPPYEHETLRIRIEDVLKKVSS